MKLYTELNRLQPDQFWLGKEVKFNGSLDLIVEVFATICTSYSTTMFLGAKKADATKTLSPYSFQLVLPKMNSVWKVAGT